MTLLFVHQGLARTLVLFLLICAGWGWLNVARRTGASGSYLGTLAIAESVLLVQALMGVLLVVAGYQPATWLHVLYGALGGLSLPAAHGYARTQDDRRAALVYAIAALFVFGLIVRAVMTATR